MNCLGSCRRFELRQNEPPLRLTAAAGERKVACWHSEQVADWEPGGDAGR